MLRISSLFVVISWSTVVLCIAMTSLLQQQVVVAVVGEEAAYDHPSCKEPKNRIIEENCKIGSSSTEWDINGFGDPSIQGFSTDISYNVGATAHFKIDSTDARSFAVDIYRMGFYQGLGARHVGTARVTVSKFPVAQPPCKVNESTWEYSCKDWKVTAIWDIPKDAVPGYYIARPVRTDGVAPKTWRADNSQAGSDPRFAMGGPNASDAAIIAPGRHKYGANRMRSSTATGGSMLRNPINEPQASHIYFIVRDDTSTADVVMQSSDTVWQAYNHYGGTSTYGSYKPEDPRPRCFKASLDRPLRTRETRPANAFLGSEFPMVQFLESKGYDVTYIAGVDTDRLGVKRLLQHKLFLSVGHDEYWSAPQRANIEAARNKGLHIAFLSGNEMFWRIRWEDNYRTMVVYKETQHTVKLDPEEKEWTGTWRDARPINPLGPQPENAIIGQLFTFNAWRNDPLIVPRRFSTLRLWKNTIVENMKEPFVAFLRGILGHEMDEDVDNGFRPPGVIHMSETPVDNSMYIVDAGSTYDSGSGMHRLTLYKHRKSGAIVFGAGTCQWSWALAPFHDSESGIPAPAVNHLNTRVGTDVFSPVRDIQQFTVNLFNEMGGVRPHNITGTGLVVPPADDLAHDNTPPACHIHSIFTFAERDRHQKVVADTVDGLPETVLHVVVEASDRGGGVVAGVEASAAGPHYERWHYGLPQSEEPLTGAASLWSIEVPLREFGKNVEEEFSKLVPDARAAQRCSCNNGGGSAEEGKEPCPAEVVALLERMQHVVRCRATDDSLNTNFHDEEIHTASPSDNSDL